MRSHLLFLGLFLAVVYSVPTANFDFTPITYFPGSWKMMKETFKSDAVDEHKIEYYTNLNVTVQNEKELYFKFYDNKTNEVDTGKSFISTVSDDMVMTFPPFVDVDTHTVVSLHFQTLVANSSYVRNRLFCSCRLPFPKILQALLR